jgi:phosphoribosylaminoimidazole-succinocarboxamide synthase
MYERLADLHEASGKVREIYSFGDELLLVASDRMSAFDVVMPTPIPDKGRILTALSAFWFERTSSLAPNHMISIDQKDFPDAARDDRRLAGRSMLVRRLTMMPIECVVRGYLAGSAWKDYQATGATCGHALPAGLRESDRLPTPIFTPATKATSGHDINIDRETAVLLLGDEKRYDELEHLSLNLYEQAAGYALERGIIIADTKFEFGIDHSGQLILGDEVLTPDSSRFWPADSYEPGGPQPSFDKQFLRDWLERQDWDKQPPGPDLPDDVVAGTRERYADAYMRLTGEPISAYLRRQGAT